MKKATSRIADDAIPILTQARLKELLNYDPLSGDFVWIKQASSRALAGSNAGCQNSAGYIVIAIDGVQYRAHRLAWLYMSGSFPQKFLDHRDLNRANNRFENLREASYCENSWNRPISSNNSSGVKGISFDKKNGVWRATFFYKGKKIDVGRFDSIEKAKEQVQLRRSELHGQFANHGV
jgi:hypothetical protein